MTRPTYIHISTSALKHNVLQVKQLAPGKKIIAMVKSNGYGCGLNKVIPTLENHVDAFGVACLDEAIKVYELSPHSQCLIFQGIFSADELIMLENYPFQCVVHQARQLEWIVNTPLKKMLKIWVKVNTGMNRLGFEPHEVNEVIRSLHNIPWVDKSIGLMTHLACADEPTHVNNAVQANCFNQLTLPPAIQLTRSMANSATIISNSSAHFDAVRPGIMLYGASPFSTISAAELNLIPVMQFSSAISSLFQCKQNAYVGYGSTWQAKRDSVIGVVAVGYGDGYPRHIANNTLVSVNGFKAPIVGRVSMDTLTIDLTDCREIREGDKVELWGQDIPIETVAKSAGTIPYELLCQVSQRVNRV